jgi:hypothetical protein
LLDLKRRAGAEFASLFQGWNAFDVARHDQSLARRRINRNDLCSAEKAAISARDPVERELVVDVGLRVVVPKAQVAAPAWGTVHPVGYSHRHSMYWWSVAAYASNAKGRARPEACQSDPALASTRVLRLLISGDVETRIL